MKRYFYLAFKVMRGFSNIIEPDFIAMVFPRSDVQPHLCDKLYTCKRRKEPNNDVMVMFDFYESLDEEHQLWFDQWFNAEMAKVNATTIQHTAGSLANGDDPKVERLKGVLLTVKDELVFGGDWASGRRIIDEVMKEL